MIKHLLRGLLAAFLLSSAAFAGTCPDVFLGGKPPEVSAPAPLVQICHVGYILGYDPARITPVWSAEHIKASGLGGDKAERSNKFFPELALLHEERAELKDFVRSNCDRGHMTPSGDFTDQAAQDDTFALSNTPPQDKYLNEQPWRLLEAMIRTEAAKGGETWIVTGVIVDPDARKLNGRVPVPSFYWKAVWRADLGAVAYIGDNDGAAKVIEISLSDLKAKAGVDPFPGLTDDQRINQGWPDAPTAKPNPHPERVCGGGQ